MANLMLASGLIPNGNGNRDTMEVLIENAVIFFRAGGMITLTDWMGLNDSEKIALVIGRESFQRDMEEVYLLERIIDQTAGKLNEITI